MSGRSGIRAVALGSLALGLALATGAALAQDGAGSADAPAAVEEMGMPPGEGGQATTAPSKPSEAAAPAPTTAWNLMQVWGEAAGSLDAKVASARRASLEAGVWSFDPAARAVLGGDLGGDALERARAAVALAPELPLAHMELARAQWLHADAPMAAMRAAEGAMRAIATHPEASLWFAGSGFFVLAIGLCTGASMLWLLVALRAALHAAHDLGHLAPGNPPAFARFALLAALVLLPLAAGEGGFGVALALLALGVAYGGAGQRVVLVLSAATLWAALYPMARTSAAALEAFPNDTVARAAYSLSQGMASAADVRRLEAAQNDPLALRAMAIDARRRGHLGRADALYQQILATSPGDVAMMNNAANVRLALGHMENAIELYARALDVTQSPVVLFNLSQAYGRGFRVDDLNRALSDAQRADGELVAELTALQRVRNDDFLVDLPLDVSLLWPRALAPGSGEALAASLRRPFAPGRLGSSEASGAQALGAAVGAGFALGAFLRRSRSCARCGSRMCVRCETDWASAQCQSCDLLFNHPERTDRALRFARLEALRKRDRRVGRAATVVSLCVPGAAGLLANQPLRAFAAVVGVGVAAACLFWRDGVVPDPLIAGAAAPALFVGVAVLSLLVTAASLISSLAARRGGDA
jgi:tetratricopeptide (TPR) repeat protein